MPGEPDIFIGELLLAVPGDSDLDGRRVSEELARELRNLPPLPSPGAAVTLPALNLDVQVRSGTSHREVAAAVAEALHRALANAASSPSPAPVSELEGVESNPLLAMAEEPSAPAPPEAPAPALEDATAPRAIDRPAPPSPARPARRRTKRPPRATGPDPARGNMSVEDVPPAEILAERLLAGELTPSGLADLLENLPPLAAQERAVALLRALDAEVAVTPATPPFPTSREIDEGLRLSRSRPPVPPSVEKARQAAIAALTLARDRRAAEEIASLTPFLRQGIIDGLPKHQITAPAWDRIKALLLAQFGTMANAEAYYRTNIKLGAAFHRNFPAHKRMVAALERAETKLKNDLKGEAEVDVTIGGLVVRTIEGTGRLSLHAGGLAVDVLPSKNPMFKDKRFGDLKTAARIITGSEQSLETFAKLLQTKSDAEASGSPDGDLLKAATDLIETSKKIETVLSDDKEVAVQIVRIVRDAGSEAPNNALAAAVDDLVSATGKVDRAVSEFVKANLGGHNSQVEEDVASLIRLRRQARPRGGFFVLSLPARFIVALMAPDGGDLKWLGAAHDRKDYMHFEVKNGRDLLKQ